ncbi:MAG: hypothetical protein D8M59_17130 [Planctomycetes bacterium]|nr:hypothetical protein [Planctomycetota bacterium]
MIRIIEKPHLIFFVAIPIIILLGIFSGENLLDINLHDTYYIISFVEISYLISLLFLFIGLCYWVIFKFNKTLLISLSKIHILFTIGGTILWWFSAFNFFLDPKSFDVNFTMSVISSILEVIILIGQFCFLINILIGILGKRK